MTHGKLVLALGMIAAATPALASEDRPTAAPPGTPDTKYCMRIVATTGTLIEQTKCWTREHWPCAASMWTRTGPRKASAR